MTATLTALTPYQRAIQLLNNAALPKRERLDGIIWATKRKKDEVQMARLIARTLARIKEREAELSGLDKYERRAIDTPNQQAA